MLRHLPSVWELGDGGKEREGMRMLRRASRITFRITKHRIESKAIAGRIPLSDECVCGRDIRHRLHRSHQAPKPISIAPIRRNAPIRIPVRRLRVCRFCVLFKFPPVPLLLADRAPFRMHDPPEPKWKWIGQQWRRLIMVGRWRIPLGFGAIVAFAATAEINP